MNKKEKRSGRPEVYTDKQLKDILLKYTVKNTGKKINSLQLEKETGIKRHVWSRRMKQEIDDLKSPVDSELGGRDGSLPLPNVVELVETYWSNKKKLIQSLCHVNELIQSSYEQALLYHRKCTEYEDLEKEFCRKIEIIKQLEDRILYIEKKYLEVTVQSTYKSIQKEHGLINVIELKNKNTDQPALSTNFKKNYKELFD